LRGVRLREIVFLQKSNPRWVFALQIFSFTEREFKGLI
jgi:hypothetical protein